MSTLLCVSISYRMPDVYWVFNNRSMDGWTAETSFCACQRGSNSRGRILGQEVKERSLSHFCCLQYSFNLNS